MGQCVLTEMIQSESMLFKYGFIDIHPVDFPTIKKNNFGVCLTFESYLVRTPGKRNLLQFWIKFDPRSVDEEM